MAVYDVSMSFIAIVPDVLMSGTIKNPQPALRVRVFLKLLSLCQRIAKPPSITMTLIMTSTLLRLSLFNFFS